MDERIREIIRQLDLRDNDIDLERFAELNRADEREACAKLCDELSATKNGYGCARAIRARGKK